MGYGAIKNRLNQQIILSVRMNRRVQILVAAVLFFSATSYAQNANASIAVGTPTLTPIQGSERLSLRVVKVDDAWNLSRHLCQIIFPGGFLDTERELIFTKLHTETKVSSSLIILNGEKSGYRYVSEISTPMSGQFTDVNYFRMKVSISTGTLSPDHYTGMLYLTLTDPEATITVPVDLQVQSSPFWPLIILLVSIVVGRLFKYMQDRGNARADSLRLVYRAKGRSGRLHQDDRLIIDPMIEELLHSVYEDNTKDIALTLSDIDRRFVQLKELRQYEQALRAQDEGTRAQQLLSSIPVIRQFIRLKKDDKASALLEQLEAGFVELSVVSYALGSDDGFDEDEPLEVHENRSRKLDRVSNVGNVSDGTVKRAVAKWLVRISGLSDEIRAEATLWIVKPLLWAVLVVALLALGLKTLYFDNPAFGSVPFSDYASLAFWGLSSDVAGRTLTSIGALKREEKPDKNS